MKGQIILRNLQWLGRHNPGFPPGSVQTAVAELLNPTGSILPYSGRLCLDKPAIVCTGTKYFNIDAGATKDVKFPILMPTEEGTYPVYLDIFSNDELVETYQAPEDVVISLFKYTLEVTVEPPGAGYVTKSPSKATYSPGEVVTLTAHPYSGYEFDHWGGWPPYPGVGSTSPTLNIRMTDNWWVVAAFREKAAPPPVEYTLEVTVEPPGAGYVTKSPSKAKYSAGEVVTLTAHPYSGYEFDHWGGWPPYPGIQSTSPTLNLTMTDNWWVVAAFREAAPPTEIKTIQEIADEVNRELGGSYVNGMLTPPAWWTGSVTEWSRHVQDIAWERYYQQF